MAFNWPISPTEGQIYTPVGGPTYVFNSPVWKAMGQGQIAIVSDSAPANPANGQLWWESDTGILFVYVNDGNSSQWVQCGGIQADVASISNLVQTIITSSGTYTKPAGLRYLEVTLVGGGGGSPSTPAGTPASQAAGSSGGGGGGTLIRLFAASDLAASTTMTVGLGGIVSPVGAGGTTSFGAYNASGGGAGGSVAAGTSSTFTGGGPGGVAATGQINKAGENGGAGGRNMHGVGNFGWGGSGGGTLYGTRLTETVALTSSVSIAGNFPGGGARGCAIGASQSAQGGAAGGDGCIILKEYF